MIRSDWFLVHIRAADLVMTMTQPVDADGAQLHVAKPLRDALHQYFRLEQQADGFYCIRSRVSDKVLDIWQASRARRTPVVQWTWHGGDNQRFAVVEADDGWLSIRAKHSGLALTLTADARRDGGLVVQDDLHVETAHVWRLAAPID